MKKLFSCLSFFISVLSFSQNNTFSLAPLIPTTSTCVTNTNQFIGHTISGATNENTLAISGIACGASNTARDVWYRFTAQSEFPVISVTPTGSSWTTAQRIRIQILSGTVLTALAERGCGSSSNTTPTFPATINNTPVVVSPSSALTPGTTYYVRISTSGTPTGLNYVYNICIREGTASRMGEIFKQTILSPAQPTAGFLNYPWEVTYGPDDSLWITESRAYRLIKMHNSNGGKRTILDLSNGSTWLGPVTGTGNDTLCAAQAPGTWNPWPQGGFAGMAIHPQFGTGASKDFVYVTYVHRYLSGTSPGGIFYRNKIVRFTYNFTSGRLGSPAIMANDLPGSKDHNSQRMIIAPVVASGTPYLFMASGDMGSGQYENRFRVMNPENINSYEGKILRFNLESDGDAGANAWIPNDNPYNTLVGSQTAVWNIGMRNNQGFAYDATTNILYGSSHGAYSDDEINIIEGFKHYGHPRIIGYADGNYNGGTSYTTSAPYTTVSAGSDATSCNPTPFVPPTGYGFVSPFCGQSTAPPIGNEVTNVTNINAGANGQYKDPLFSAYAPNQASITATWQSPGNNANWRSEGWSGLDLYSNSVIPGWKRSLIASGLKWGRLIKLNLNTAGTATLPSNVTGSNANEGDTITYFQSGNRYRDMAFDPNGKDVYIVMDNSSATSGPGVGNPTVPACPGCVIKYTFLGYVNDGTALGKSTIPTTIDVTTGAVNTCTNGNAVTIDATNNRLWVPITGPDGNILAEINADGNNLGVVTASFYKRSGGIRVAGGIRYLDRNITITPTVQPTTDVKIRLYFSKAEYDALDADGFSGVNAISDIKILKNDDVCGAAVASTTQIINPTVAEAHGIANGYVLQATIPDFSSFYFAASNITLPLDLLTFTGTLQADGSALLNWETAAERNTSHFKVERSNDGTNFYSIGQVAALGNTTTTHSYSFTDADAARQQSPVIYYRLKMVDIDGASTYSSIVPIALGNIVGKLSVYPNPVQDVITTEIVSISSGPANWTIVDNNGRVLLQNRIMLMKGKNSFNINLQSLSAGVYYLKVTGQDIDKSVKIQKL